MKVAKDSDWKTMGLDSGMWIVWSVKTQTRTARDCPNTKWFTTKVAAQEFVAQQK